MTKEKHDDSYMKGEERERKEKETGEEKKRRREKGEMNTTISAQLVDSLHHHTKPNYNNHKLLHHHLLLFSSCLFFASLLLLLVLIVVTRTARLDRYLFFDFSCSLFLLFCYCFIGTEGGGWKGMEGDGCGRSWHGGEAEEEEGRARRVGWRRDVEVVICGASSSFVMTTIVYISKGLSPLPSLPSHPSHPSLSSRPSSYIHFT